MVFVQYAFTSLLGDSAQQSAYDQARSKAEGTASDLKASAEAAYARALGKGSELTSDMKSKLDSEYAAARARQAGAKGDKAVAEGS